MIYCYNKLWRITLLVLLALALTDELDFVKRSNNILLSPRKCFENYTCLGNACFRHRRLVFIYAFLHTVRHDIFKVSYACIRPSKYNPNNFQLYLYRLAIRCCSQMSYFFGHHSEQLHTRHASTYDKQLLFLTDHFFSSLSGGR